MCRNRGNTPTTILKVIHASITFRAREGTGNHVYENLVQYTQVLHVNPSGDNGVFMSYIDKKRRTAGIKYRVVGLKLCIASPAVPIPFKYHASTAQTSARAYGQ
jgi:hypothetical protein